MKMNVGSDSKNLSFHKLPRKPHNSTSPRGKEVVFHPRNSQTGSVDIGSFAFPQLLLLHVFSYADVVDLCRFCLVSKAWKVASEADHFWIKNFNSYYDTNKCSLSGEDEEIANLLRQGGVKALFVEKVKMLNHSPGKKEIITCVNIEDLAEWDPPAEIKAHYTERQYLDEYPQDLDDPNSIEHEGGQILCATLDRLVQELTSHENYDSDFLFSFMLTYRSITTSRVLWQKLVQRYNFPPPPRCTLEEFMKFKKDKLDRIRIRVTQAIKYWLEHHFYDFDSELLECFHSGLIMMENSKGEAFAKMLRGTFSKIQKDTAEIRSTASAPKPMFPLTMKIIKRSILKWPELEIARQMALLDFEIFSRIRPKECLNQSWAKENRAQQAPNIHAIIQRFNTFSSWVGTTVVQQEDVKKRADIITKFIKIAEKLDELNDFNGVYAVISGLNLSGIYRLKKTWELIKPEDKQMYDQLSLLLSRDKNFKHIRTKIKQINPPCIPYVGLYLTDLTFIEDGNPKMINNKFNFMKCRKFSMVIRDLQTYQQTPYNFIEVKELREQLLNLKILDEVEMYDLSLIREPRVPKTPRMSTLQSPN